MQMEDLAYFHRIVQPLCVFVMGVTSNERVLEIKRQLLLQDSGFSPKSAFIRISRDISEIGKIRVNDLMDFLKDNRCSPERFMCQGLVDYFGTNGAINFAQFLNLIRPKEHLDSPQKKVFNGEEDIDTRRAGGQNGSANYQASNSESKEYYHTEHISPTAESLLCSIIWREIELFREASVDKLALDNAGCDAKSLIEIVEGFKSSHNQKRNRNPNKKTSSSGFSAGSRSSDHSEGSTPVEAHNARQRHATQSIPSSSHPADNLSSLHPQITVNGGIYIKSFPHQSTPSNPSGPFPNINYQSLSRLFNRHRIQIYDREIITFIRRLDKDDDGVIGLAELTAFLSIVDGFSNNPKISSVSSEELKEISPDIYRSSKDSGIAGRGENGEGERRRRGSRHFETNDNKPQGNNSFRTNTQEDENYHFVGITTTTPQPSTLEHRKSSIDTPTHLPRITLPRMHTYGLDPSPGPAPSQDQNPDPLSDLHLTRADPSPPKDIDQRRVLDYAHPIPPVQAVSILDRQRILNRSIEDILSNPSSVHALNRSKDRIKRGDGVGSLNRSRIDDRLEMERSDGIDGIGGGREDGRNRSTGEVMYGKRDLSQEVEASDPMADDPPQPNTLKQRIMDIRQKRMKRDEGENVRNRTFEEAPQTRKNDLSYLGLKTSITPNTSTLKEKYSHENSHKSKPSTTSDNSRINKENMYGNITSQLLERGIMNKDSLKQQRTKNFVKLNNTLQTESSRYTKLLGLESSDEKKYSKVATNSKSKCVVKPAGEFSSAESQKQASMRTPTQDRLRKHNTQASRVLGQNLAPDSGRVSELSFKAKKSPASPNYPQESSLAFSDLKFVKRAFRGEDDRIRDVRGGATNKLIVPRGSRESSHQKKSTEDEGFSIFAAVLASLSRHEISVEQSKRLLWTQPDFSPQKLFKLFDRHGQSVLTLEDLKYGLVSIGVNNAEMRVLWSMIQSSHPSQGAFITLTDFTNMLNPSDIHSIQGKTGGQPLSQETILLAADVFTKLCLYTKVYQDCKRQLRDFNVDINFCFERLDTHGKGSLSASSVDSS
jgi:Ca2+-binding EF-hand superfamily protein